MDEQVDSKTTRKSSLIIFGVIFVLLLTIGIGLAMYFENENSIVDEPIACTADAMQCPDGTWVGRTGPNCEFVCP